MGDFKGASDSGKAKPDTALDCTITCSAHPQPKCPDGCAKVPKIKAVKESYVVVLDQTGAAKSGYPVLEFEITGGCPNHYVDIQVEKKGSKALSGGPGLAKSWDRSKLAKDRLTMNAFSSWTYGSTSMRLDSSGSATYRMPLEWWQDIARQPKTAKGYEDTDVYFRVLAFCSPSSKPVSSAVSHVKLLNNLVDFQVLTNNDAYFKRSKPADLSKFSSRLGSKKDFGVNDTVHMWFEVREQGTTEMYCMVQWKKGKRQIWGGKAKYSIVKQYGLSAEANYPVWTLDISNLNPRYNSGNNFNFPTDSDQKTAYNGDHPTGTPGLDEEAGETHAYFGVDFKTELYLNTDIPSKAELKIMEQKPAGVHKGSVQPVGIAVADFGKSIEPAKIESYAWKIRVLAAKGKSFSFPEEFKGP